MRRWVILLLLLLCPCAAEAAEWSRAYGGRGRDELTMLASAEGALLAAGWTTSTDGDLSGRSREGKSGWLLCVNEEGRVVFSCCTAHAGRSEMAAPYAHADGTYSAVLWGEGRGAEWIRVSEKGRVFSRVELSAKALCPHGGGSVEQARAIDRDGAKLLGAIRHEDGTCCIAELSEDGSVTPGEVFEGGAGGRLIADRTGGAVWLAQEEGSVFLSRLFPERSEAAVSGLNAQSISDGLVQSDGSVTFCAAGEAGGCLVRLSVENEPIFTLLLEDAPVCLCQTETGFAVAGREGSLLFVDEDGNVLEEHPQAAANTAALCGMAGGVALLDNRSGQERPVVTAFAQSVFSAEQGEEPLPAEPSPVQPSADNRTIAAQDGCMLRCQSDKRGVTVRMIDADGRERFSTRIPISTAADALVWRTAMLLDDGGVLLGGHYATQSGRGVVTEGVAALLSADGILRDIRTVEGASDVLGASQDAQGRVFLRVQRRDGEEAVVPFAG